MKTKQIKTKMTAVALSTMMITSVITCPGVIQPVSAINTPSSTNAVADVTFSADIKNDVNGVVTDIPCEFKVTKPASNGKKGEVQVGNGAYSAIGFTTTGTITIPETVGYGTDEYTVTSIGDYAFNSCSSLESTGLESNSTVTSIGDDAFTGCISLQSTGLERNSTVTSIGDSAFEHCTSLKSTGLESNSTVTSIGGFAFAGCTSLKNTGLESNSTVTSIGDVAFYGCTSLVSTGLESNKTVTSIGANAFNGCSTLKSTGLESNKTVTGIGEGAFSGCTSLKSTGLESNSTVTSIGDVAFHGCTSLVSTGLANNSTLASIGYGVFQNCISLQSTGLESNSTVTSIGVAAFGDCTKLKSTGLQSNTTVTSIGQAGFSGCSSLESTGLESNSRVISIGEAAFYGCDSLQSTGLESNSTVISIGVNAFIGCTSLGNIIFKTTTLPTMDNSNGGIFAGTNAKVYYLPETINPEQLTGCGAANIELITVDTITVKNKPKDTYIVSQTFDPSGLVLEVKYDNAIIEEIKYNKYTEFLFDFDKTTLATSDKEVKITYLGKEVSLPITVTSQEKVKTNDSTTDINGIVLSLLVTGILSVVLVKRKRDIVE